MKIYLDDERSTPEGWYRCYHVWEVIKLLEENQQTNQIEVLSLDHDLGSGEPTGYEVLLWLEEKIANSPNFQLPERILVHSANPVGKDKMKAAICSIFRLKQKQNEGRIPPEIYEIQGPADSEGRVRKIVQEEREKGW